MRTNKYFRNLSILSTNKHNIKNVYSYKTLVAEINDIDMTIKKIDWKVNGKTSSPTTSKHINYVANFNNLTFIN